MTFKIFLGYCDTEYFLAVTDDNTKRSFLRLLPVLSIYVNVIPYFAVYTPKLHAPLSPSSETLILLFFLPLAHPHIANVSR